MEIDKGLGWVQMYRSVHDQLIDSDPLALFVFIHFLAKASRKKLRVKIGNEIKDFDEGSLVIGLRSTALRLGISKTTLRRRIDALLLWDMIVPVMTQDGIIVTIRNWKELYEYNGPVEIHDNERYGTDVTPNNKNKNKNNKNSCVQDSEFLTDSENIKSSQNARSATFCAITELAGNPISDALLQKIKPELQAKWVGHYGQPEWIKAEVAKAAIWIEANTNRAPKSQWGRFLSQWLSRSWERDRGSIGRRRDAPQINMVPIDPEKLFA
jgi:hypothetical protein